MDESKATSYSDYADFAALLASTPVSSLLLYCSVATVRITGPFFTFVVEHRPTIQFAIQIVANLLAIAQIMVLARLASFVIRRRLALDGMTLDTMRFFADAMTPHMNWSLPWSLWLPLSLIMVFSTSLRGLWAAALTPIEHWKATDGHVLIPSWENTTLVREYPSEVGREGPTLQTTKGRFSYSVGTQLLGSLLASAASSTPNDGRIRHHGKMDNSKYTYVGRSYGVGSTAGLIDDDISSNDLAIAYSYQEVGYRAEVDCIYNRTSDFRIQKDGGWVYAAVGNLPDSDQGPEYSNYIGHDGSNIVAIGVAHFDSDRETVPLRRYLAFSTGRNYDFLNQIQCRVDFLPTRFNVTVNLAGRNITVAATTDEGVEDIDPSRRLKGTLLRQFELMANDETNIYVSMVGTAFNASIVDMHTVSLENDPSLDLYDPDVVLGGVQNSVTAVADDMLGAYAAAQAMVGEARGRTPADVRVAAVSIGTLGLAAAVFSVNSITVLLLLAEAFRTKLWRGYPKFDFADIRQVAVAAFQKREYLVPVTSDPKMAPVGDVRVKLGMHP